MISSISSWRVDGGVPPPAGHPSGTLVGARRPQRGAHRARPGEVRPQDVPLLGGDQLFKEGSDEVETEPAEIITSEETNHAHNEIHGSRVVREGNPVDETGILDRLVVE